MENMYHANSNHNKAGVAILILGQKKILKQKIY